MSPSRAGARAVARESPKPAPGQSREPAPMPAGNPLWQSLSLDARGPQGTGAAAPDPGPPGGRSHARWPFGLLADGERALVLALRTAPDGPADPPVAWALSPDWRTAGTHRDDAPTGPAQVQRKCPACALEDEEIRRAPSPDSRTRTSAPEAWDGLQIGPAQDPYEAEADRIADLAMSIPDSALGDPGLPDAGSPGLGQAGETAGPGRPALAPIRVQRQESDGEEIVTGEIGPESADPLAARGEGEETAADDESEPEIQCKRAAPNMDPGESVAGRLRDTRGSGSPLPQTTRTFMERRIGIDFSGVRVHTDNRAADLSASLGAIAFASGYDLYFATGHYRPGTASGDRLLAHELTHVVQQSGGAPPGAVDPGARARVQRSTSYERKDYYERYPDPTFPTGRVIHHHVEQRLRAENRNLITEAPIPGATAGDIAPNLIGSADLYLNDHNRVPDLRADRRSNRGGELTFFPLTPVRRGRTHCSGTIDWSPGARSPIPPSTADIVARNDFPATFGVADLKPLALGPAGGGLGQVDNYRTGLGQFADLVHTASGNATRVTPRAVGFGPLRLPSALDYEGQFDPARPNQPGGGLVYGDRRIWLANRLTRGLVLYFDIPTSAPAPRLLQGYNRLLEQMHDIVDDLRQPGPPIPNASGIGGTRRRPGIAALGRPPAPRQPSRRPEAPLVQRVPTVDWAARGRRWEDRRRTWGRDARALLRGSGRGLGRRLAVDRALGVSRPNPRGRPGDQGTEFRRLKLWSGRIGQLLGRVRFLMGRTFERVADRFEHFRERFRRWHRQARGMAGGSPGGGWRRTLIRILLRALQTAVSRLMAESYRIFADCANGIVRKAVRMVTDDASELVRDRVCHLHRAFDAFKDRIETEFETRFGPIETLVATGNTIAQVGQTVLTMVTLLRLGFQAVACLSPPALGCLWGLVGQLALELVLELIVGTQWFEEHIVRHPSIRDLLLSAVGPQYQRLIHGTLEAVGLQDFASDVTECVIQVPELGGLLQGERALEGQPLAAHRAAFEGRHRGAMLASLRTHFTGEDGRPATERELRDLLAEMGRRGLSPEGIRDLVEQGRTGADGRISAPTMRRVLAGEDASPPPAAGTPQPPAAAPGDAPEETPVADPADPGGGAGRGERGTDGRPAGGVPVAPATDRRYDGTGGQDLKGAVARIREGHGSHTVGSEPTVDIVAYWQGTAVEIVTDVPTRVVRRTFRPEGSTAQTATQLAIRYELLIGVRFTRIPGGGVLERGHPMVALVPWSRPAP